MRIRLQFHSNADPHEPSLRRHDDLFLGCHAFRREPCGEPVGERGAAHEHRQDGYAGPVRAAHVGGDGAVRPPTRLHARLSRQPSSDGRAPQIKARLAFFLLLLVIVNYWLWYTFIIFIIMFQAKNVAANILWLPVHNLDVNYRLCSPFRKIQFFCFVVISPHYFGVFSELP